MESIVERCWHSMLLFSAEPLMLELLSIGSQRDGRNLPRDPVSFDWPLVSCLVPPGHGRWNAVVLGRRDQHSTQRCIHLRDNGFDSTIGLGHPWPLLLVNPHPLEFHSPPDGHGHLVAASYAHVVVVATLASRYQCRR